MLTVEAIKEFGADTDDGLQRCMGNEGLYLRLVGIILKDPGFDDLKNAVEGGDLTRAFEAAHALKGALGNLSLTPLYKPVSEITELLRNRTETDYSEILSLILSEKEKLEELAEA